MGEISICEQTPLPRVLTPPPRLKVMRRRIIATAGVVPVAAGAILGVCISPIQPNGAAPFGLLLAIVVAMITSSVGFYVIRRMFWKPITDKATADLRKREFQIVWIREEPSTRTRSTQVEFRFVLEAPEYPNSREPVRWSEATMPLSRCHWYEGTGVECTQPMVVRFAAAFYYLDSEHNLSWGDEASFWLDRSGDHST